MTQSGCGPFAGSPWRLSVRGRSPFAIDSTLVALAAVAVLFVEDPGLLRNHESVHFELFKSGFGFIQYFLYPNRQTLHDRITETIVISEWKRKADPPRPAVPASGR